MSSETKTKGLAHDINNKLAILQANNLVMKKLLSKAEVDAKIEKIIESNIKTLKDINELIDSVRELERAQSDKLAS